MPATGYCAIGSDIIAFSDGSTGSLDVNGDGIINLEDLRGFEQIYRQGNSTLTEADIRAIEDFLTSVGQACTVRLGAVTPPPNPDPVTDPDTVIDPPRVAGCPNLGPQANATLWANRRDNWDWCDQPADWRAAFEDKRCRIYRRTGADWCIDGNDLANPVRCSSAGGTLGTARLGCYLAYTAMIDSTADGIDNPTAQTRERLLAYGSLHSSLKKPGGDDICPTTGASARDICGVDENGDGEWDERDGWRVVLSTPSALGKFAWGT